MNIEVTDADVAEFEKLLDLAGYDWHASITKRIIAAAWRVMSEKHGLESAIEKALCDLPEDYEIRIWVEGGWAGVECFDADGDKVKWLNTDCLEADLREALQAAMVHANDPRRNQ